MKSVFCNNASSSMSFGQSSVKTSPSPTKSRLGIFSLALALAATLAFTPSARADSYVFSFSGGGLSASGVIDVSNATVPGVPGGYQITGISGTFSDSNQGISNATITGLQTTSLPNVTNADGTFVPPGSPADGFGFSYDNLFYPDGNSPSVCPPDPTDPNGLYPFGGGTLDIYGLLFNVDGGYSVDVWSNGVLPGLGLSYGAGDSLNGQKLTSFGEPFDGNSVNFTASPVPEPTSLMLMGTGVLGLVGVVRRKLAA
ncbi:MAG TPA: PEP-CTERM sorting domain-containing protein [Edaphobacter sp.]|nr:PEP-CTERM sorting domain-containing protein [Edaphobacter sp.]